MYIPDHFSETDPTVIARLLRQNGFALLVSGSGDSLQATHLPLTYHPEIGARGSLFGHVARANEHWRSLGGATVLAIFTGQHGYISPSWYRTGPSVPTWNYEAVHIYGTAQLRDGETKLRPILEALTGQFEDPAWSLADQPADYIHRMSRAIIGIEIAITSVQAKRKLSQNRPAADIDGVVRALDASGADADRALAAAMREAAPKPS
jgi:transcriptional regulator